LGNVQKKYWKALLFMVNGQLGSETILFQKPVRLALLWSRPEKVCIACTYRLSFVR
jgi:hypothetical protein